MSIKILTEPAEFFRSRVDNPGLLVPILIVLVTAIIAAVGVIPRAELTGQLASDAAQSQGQQLNESATDAVAAVSVVSGVFFGFIVVLVGWVLYSVVFYLLARFAFDGSGSLRNTFALTGWGYVPLIVKQIVNAAATYYVFSDASLPEGTDAAQSAFQELQNDPAMLGAGVLGLLLLAWSAVIWTAAMRQLHDLSRRDAILTVGIPVGIVFLSQAVGLV